MPLVPTTTTVTQLPTPPLPRLRQPHSDLIHLWAEGWRIEAQAPGTEEWFESRSPGFYPHYKYRARLPEFTLISDGVAVTIHFHPSPIIQELSNGQA